MDVSIRLLLGDRGQVLSHCRHKNAAIDALHGVDVSTLNAYVVSIYFFSCIF